MRYRAAPMMRQYAGSEHVRGDPKDPELTAVHQQLIVFAHELGQLYHVERSRSTELQRILESLQDMYLATMRSLAHMIEAKDQTTRGHLDRTQALGVALARRIDPALADRPEHILCKEGPLTNEEWEIVRTHPALGAKIVAPIRFLGDAALVIRHHHEWFDGGGYPDGLGGAAIPLAARVFAVADSFDAMTNDRPYRNALPRERALGEIQEGSGTQFDPDVVEAFVRMSEEEPSPFWSGMGLPYPDRSDADLLRFDGNGSDPDLARTG